MAMEALTYDRAQAYSAEIPESEYDTWQPKKLLQVLIDIDPNAGKDSSLSIGIEIAPGVPPPVMQSLGSETVLNLATLKKHHDALGSYLHMPTMKQITAGKGHDFKRLRQRCQEITDYVAKVLASPIFNITIGSFQELPCAECQTVIRRRMPPDGVTFPLRSGPPVE